MKTHLTEGKFLFYTTSAIILFIGIHIFNQQLTAFYNPDNYVGFHTLLEVFSIAISSGICLYGLKGFVKTKSSLALLLSFTFFVVGSLDLMHTLSFKGMPYFFSESSFAKATWFWVSARIIQALLLLALLVVPEWKVKRDYRFPVILLGAILVGLISSVVIFFEQSLPVLIIEGQGTTPLKNGMEYFVSFVQFISLIITLYQYYMVKSEAKLALAMALVYLLLTSLIFTVYRSVFDIDNFSGHLFKALGFYFILKGFYFMSSEHEREEQEHQKLINELPGLIFIAARKGNEFILTFIQGELIKQLGLDEEHTIGRALREIFNDQHAMVNDYCRFALRHRERSVFEFDFIDRTLVISIKPLIDENGGEEIIGTVIDMPGFYQEPGLNKKAVM